MPQFSTAGYSRAIEFPETPGSATLMAAHNH